jgi:hypothetical protein
MAWQRFLVSIKGEDPIEVQTNARDMAAIVMDAANPRPLDIMFQQVHNAMRRQQMNVPRDYPSFLEVLDGVPEPVGDDVDGLDPTKPDQ